MKLMINIPKEFEQDFKNDKFNEFFGRVRADIDGTVCGKYEFETLDMLENAFENADEKEIANGKIREKVKEMELETEEYERD